MGKIACIADKAGRIQHQRCMMLSKYLGDCDVFTMGQAKKIKWKHYSLVYYSNFSIFKRFPCKNRRICSVTSHKSLDAKKETIKLLKGFKAVSVNNRYLEKEFRSQIKRLYYTPNGVDTDFFCPGHKKRSGKLKIGWVGNKDRKTKNFPIVRSLMKMHFDSIQFSVIAPRKGDKVLPKNRDQMRDFYQDLDFFLVTSSTEGTPNPGLEALSCGIPIISTKVGNMVDIVKDGHSGFFIDPNAKSVVKALDVISRMPSGDIDRLSINARQSIVEGKWDWQFKKIAWLKFFEDFRNG